MRNLPPIREWSFYEKITEDFRKEILKSIVAMNLRKSPGGPTPDSAALATVAGEDKDSTGDLAIRPSTRWVHGHNGTCGGNDVEWFFREVKKSPEDFRKETLKRCLVV